jgi:hypothetical protein
MLARSPQWPARSRNGQPYGVFSASHLRRLRLRPQPIQLSLRIVAAYSRGTHATRGTLGVLTLQGVLQEYSRYKGYSRSTHAARGTPGVLTLTWDTRGVLTAMLSLRIVARIRRTAATSAPVLGHICARTAATSAPQPAAQEVDGCCWDVIAVQTEVLCFSGLLCGLGLAT